MIRTVLSFFASNLVIFFLFLPACVAQKTQVVNLRCDYRTNPLNVETASPNLSWQLVAMKRNVTQQAYRILVADDYQTIQKNTGSVWDSKKVHTDQSIQNIYRGDALLSGKTYYWKVMIWDNKGDSSWSRPASWQMGLLTHADWKGAQWIAFEKMPDSMLLLPLHAEARRTPITDILPLFRKTFSINKSIKKATVYIAGLGHFDLHINGKKCGDHFMDAGWTDYNQQALYVSFDITGHLQKGTNAIGVMLGNGFYFMPGERYLKLQLAYAFPKMICRMLIEYADGTAEDLVSNPSWKTNAGPITFSSIYGGEDYNATLEQPAWDGPLFNDLSWKNSIIVEGPPALSAQTAEPLKIFDNFIPQKISQPKPGVFVYDLGQNASGIPSIIFKGNKGAKVRLWPSELLDTNGLITTKPIGTPVYFDYTLKGGGNESWQPRFMYYGFRYIQVEGAVPTGEKNDHDLPVVVSLKGLHTRNSATSVGQFDCSNDLFNKTSRLIDWGIRSNMASVFTDCPHREKLGWLEEAHLMGPSIRYNYDIGSLCRKTVRDMINAQTAEGLVTSIAPEYGVFGGPFRDSPEWGSSSIIIPWYVYEWYGDKQLLEEAYPMIRRYLAYLNKKSRNHLLYFGLGDWYDIGPKEPGPSQQTPSGITASAYYYYDLVIAAKIATLLGKTEDAIAYQQQAAETKKSFNNKFFNATTMQYGTGSQTANAIAVYMNLTEPAYKDSVIANIVKDIRKRNNSLTAGDIGYRYLLRVLDENGLSGIIYDMNSNASVPGYGLQLQRGATALTESWQANDNASNNHMMLGHLMEWFYSGLAGIRPASNAIAFKEIEIKPQPTGNVTAARASYLCPYGMISNDWKINGSSFDLSVAIPANTTAIIYLPAKPASVIQENGKPISSSHTVQLLRFQNGYALVRVGSGNYQFSVK